jgi:transcriptional regulator with XRE-family HTH domain
MNDAQTIETIGQRIRRLREEQGLSQRSLADVGVGYAYISRIERGDRVPSVKALRLLAPKLGVTVDYLEKGADIADAEERELRLSEAELILRLEGDTDRAEAALREVLADALCHGDSRDAARARIGLGVAASHRGEHQEAIELLEAAANEPGVSPATHPTAFATLGHAYVCTGQWERGVALLRSALADLMRGSSVEGAAVVRFATYLSYALSDAGDLQDARATLDEALAYARGVEDAYTRVRLYWSNARLASLDGDFDLARTSISRAIALLEATEDTVHLGRAHLLAAEIATADQDLEDAGEHLALAESLVGLESDRMDRAWLRVQQAFVLARAGEASQAIDAATEAIELLSDGDDQTFRGTGHWALGEALAAAGAEGAARKAFREAAALIDPGAKYAGQFVEAWAKLFPADIDVR